MTEISSGGGANSYPARRIMTVKPCDLCISAPALLFCRKDTVFLCMACEAKLHGQTKHECVWMCEVCEQSPASVTCKADAAAMCAACDSDVHSANPLARRHVRIPVVPFYDSAEAVMNMNSAAANFIDPVFSYGTKEDDGDCTEIPRNVMNDSESVMKSVDLLSADDRLFNFGFGFHDSVTDAVVPVQSTAPTKNCASTPIVDHRSTGNRYEIDFNRCMINTYNKSNSQSHSVSSSSMDAGVVIQEKALLDVSNPFMLPVNNKKTKQFSAVDREARVLRYREKRKKRKFEKKIRYASRKAYAEMRPRIKGRFVKRTEFVTVLDVDRWWFTAERSANGYGAGVECGVVPSF